MRRSPDRAELSEQHLDLAVVLAHHAAMAVERGELVERLQAAEAQLREENTLLRRRAQADQAMVAQSPAMMRALQELQRAAASDVRAEDGQPLTAELLSEEIARVAPPAATGVETLAAQLACVEREIIVRALARHGGRKAAAAEELGLTRQGLVKKMGRLKIDGPTR